MRPGTRPAGPRTDGDGRAGGGRDRPWIGGGSGPHRRRLGRQPQRREAPPHGMGVGPRAEEPPPAPAAIAPQHIKAEHPLE
jgi:hypothetical protein